MGFTRRLRNVSGFLPAWRIIEGGNAGFATPSPRGRIMNDDELMHRVRVNDDGTAFRLIVKRYEKSLFRRARGILRSNADAEDAVQQAFLNLYRFRDRYQPKNWLGAYLKAVLIN